MQVLYRRPNQPRCRFRFAYDGPAGCGRLDLEQRRGRLRLEGQLRFLGLERLRLDDGNAALFAGSGTGTITVAGPVAPTGITFSTAGYTLTGGTINLGSLCLTASASATVNSALGLTSSQTWTISSACTTLTVGGSVNNGGNLLTIASSGFTTIPASSPAGGLSKTSAGTLTLTNNNSFSGGTTVNQGTVVLNSANGNRPTGTGTLTINSGATVDASAQANNFGYDSTGT